MKVSFFFFLLFRIYITFGQFKTQHIHSDSLTKSIAFGWSNPVSFIGNINDVKMKILEFMLISPPNFQIKLFKKSY